MKLTRKTLLELLNEYFDILFLTMSAAQKLLKFKASSLMLDAHTQTNSKQK